MIPKVVVFDLGKVLVDFDYGIAARKLAARSRSAAGPAQHLLDCMPILMRYERGLLTTEEFYHEIRAVIGYEGSLPEFGDAFADIFWPIEPMVQLHADLRRRAVPTYVFSNTNDLAVTHIRQNFPFYRDFEAYVLSYEHGAMKPEAALYEVVERVTARREGEILYLDDRPENIEAGAARGWQVILQETPEKSWAAVRRLGLLNGD
jgi:FMN phosphatase YigB (HAD superfamily)